MRERRGRRWYGQAVTIYESLLRLGVRAHGERVPDPRINFQAVSVYVPISMEDAEAACSKT